MAVPQYIRTVVHPVNHPYSVISRIGAYTADKMAIYIEYTVMLQNWPRMHRLDI